MIQTPHKDFEISSKAIMVPEIVLDKLDAGLDTVSIFTSSMEYLRGNDPFKLVKKPWALRDKQVPTSSKGMRSMRLSTHVGRGGFIVLKTEGHVFTVRISLAVEDILSPIDDNPVMVVAIPHTTRHLIFPPPTRGSAFFSSIREGKMRLHKVIPLNEAIKESPNLDQVTQRVGDESYVTYLYRRVPIPLMAGAYKDLHDYQPRYLFQGDFASIRAIRIHEIVEDAGPWGDLGFDTRQEAVNYLEGLLTRRRKFYTPAEEDGQLGFIIKGKIIRNEQP